MTARLQQFQAACDIYVEQIRDHPDVIGILVSGSFVDGKIDANSDIDIYILLDPSCDYRERGNTWINGVEIEYFMNPPQQIRAYFRNEKVPHTAHMLAYGKVLYRKSDLLDQLIVEAKQIMGKKPSAAKQVQVELWKYHLDDLWKDLEDSRKMGNELAAILLKNQIVEMSLELFCKKHRIWRTKHKRLAVQLKEIDPTFLAIVEDAVRSGWPDFMGLRALRDYSEELLGGERSREWKLRSPLEL